MDDSGAMRVRQRVGNLCTDPKNVSERQRTTSNALGESFPLEQLHHEKVFPDIEERADVRMTELRDRLRLAFETKTELRVLREIGGEDLHGDPTIEACVASAPHLTHSAGAETGDDLVGTSTVTRHNGSRLHGTPVIMTEPGVAGRSVTNLSARSSGAPCAAAAPAPYVAKNKIKRRTNTAPVERRGARQRPARHTLERDS